MNFSITAVFNRSVTLELNEGIGRCLTAPVELWLDQQLLRTEEHSVFSLYHLQPATTYELTVKRGKLSRTQTFTTLPESVLLDVTRFGAIGDGVTDCTSHIQAAILSCPQQGTVHIPKGTYHTGPLFLKSHVSLWLDKDAVLLAEPERTRYAVLPGMTESTDEKSEYNLGVWEGNPLDCFAALLTGIDLEHVDIYGEGVLDGNAAQGDWWQDVKVKRIAWRPYMLYLNRCADVRVQGVKFQNACSWTIHPFYSSRLLFADVKILNHEQSPNSDGIDPNCCDDVDIIGCDLSTGDDCIAIKGAKYYMSVYHYKPTTRVNIRHCVMRFGHGAVVIGSETSSGISKVRVSQCRFIGTDRGLRIKTRRGRGGKSVIDDIVMEDVEMDGVKVPFAVNMFYFCDPDGHTAAVQNREKQPVSPEITPRVGRITARRVWCENAHAAGGYFFGLPEMPIERISLTDVHIRFDPNAMPDLPVMMDGIEPVAKVGLYAQHVKELRLAQLDIEGAGESAPILTDVGTVEEKAVRYEQR